MSPYAHITGWGVAVPERILTNDEIAKMVGTNDEWIFSHTGIHERRVAADNETSASLATDAALQALQVAGLNPTSIDLIIVSTSSPEHFFPATACLVQDRIGATHAGAFDLSAACSGFIFAMNMASQAIQTGSIRSALVIGTETLTRLVDWEDRNTCILFGDGAGAFVMQANPEPGGVHAALMRSDGSGGDLLILPSPGSRYPVSIKNIENGLQYVQMNGREVFRFATRVMAQATEEVLGKAGLKLEDIQWIVPHQANLRIIEAAAKGLKFPMEKIVVNIERYGNTSTASIPLATVEAIEDGRIKPGDRIVFVGFGAGLTWGALVATWSGPFPAHRRKFRRRTVRFLARLRSALLRLLRRIDALVWGRLSGISR
jgi:3-oxoacyl-[acyl-carrier-protein] synthase III